VAGILALCILGVLAWQGNAWRHLQSGKQALRLHHHPEALRHFQAALQAWPNHGPTCLLAARAARLSEKFDIAEHYLEIAEAQPTQMDSAALERVLLRACKGEVDGVGQYCDALIKAQHPETPQVLEALALGDLKLLRFGSAADALNRWLELQPDDPQATFLLGRLHLQAANNTEAVDYLRRAVELDPSRDDARLMLAGLLLDLGQAQEALPHLEAVRLRQPENSMVAARLGQALTLLDRPAEATPLLDGVLERNPDMTLALLERAKLALREGKLAQAEPWLARACERDRGDRAAHYQYLQCLKQLGKMKEARSVQERLDKIDVDLARVRKIVTTDLPESRFDPDLHAELGELLLDVGAEQDGIVWLQRALQLDPRQPRARRAFARYYEALGQTKLAEQHRSMIVASASDQ
jgi:tetratricopeptide (TPR) repeat protein